MKFFLTGLVAAAFITASVAQVNSQTSTTGSSQTNVNASKSGASAQTSNSADANQNVKAGKKANANASGSASQNASAGADAPSLPSGTKVPAVLDKSIDSRKVKQGDEVVAKTTQDVTSNGKVIIPKNSKLIGHVTEASSRANGETDSKLGIVFDKAVLRNGSSVPMQARIQALAAPVVSAAGSMSDDTMASTPMGSAGSSGSAAGSGSAGGGGLVGGTVAGATNTVGSTAGTVGSTAGGIGSTAGSTVNSTTGATTGAVGRTATGTVSATNALNSTSTGVIGLKNLQLNSDSANSTTGSLITSTGKNVRLDSGSRLVLDVTGSASQTNQ
jgi:hypothetical protein